jgi:putative serine protease PepD
MRSPRAFATLAAAAVLGAVGGAAVVGIAGDDGGPTTTITTTEAAPRSVHVARKPSGTLTAAQVYEHAKDSVVFITAQVTQSQSSSPFGQPSEQRGEATGSGFVVSTDGHIVTNAHVVEGATRVTVKIGDGDAVGAEVVGRDASTDIALLKVTDTGGTTLKALAFADSDQLQVGDQTYAIGNPFGLDRTLTSGVVSALQRQITAPNGFSIDGVIQTDAPINPGNSGGPLLDDRGDVIGVNSQILNGAGSSESGNVGIGFAAPSNTVRNVIEQLEADGRVQHAYLGVQMGDAENGGAQVGAVADGGPAQQGGLRAGDVIVAFDGRDVADAAALSALVNARKVGDEVRLTIDRGGTRQTVTVTLGEQPASATDATQPQQTPQRQAPGEGGEPPEDPSQGQRQIDPRELLEQLIP